MKKMFLKFKVLTDLISDFDEVWQQPEDMK